MLSKTIRKGQSAATLERKFEDFLERLQLLVYNWESSGKLEELQEYIDEEKE